jgi:hypothetical protein
LHRLAVQAAPAGGSVERFLGCSLYRLAVTFIYLPGSWAKLYLFEVRAGGGVNLCDFRAKYTASISRAEKIPLFNVLSK